MLSSDPRGATARSRELQEKYEEPGRAAAYSAQRWTRSRHARRTDRREQGIVADFLERIGASKTILDVPCGAGRFRELLGRHAERVLAVDVALPMLREARDPAAIQASAHALPFTDASVDLVFCFRLLHHYALSADRASLLAELARVSRRWVLVSHFDRASFQAWRHRLRRRRTQRFSQSCRLFDGEAATAGLRVRDRRFVARGVSEQVVVLLEKIGTRRFP